MNQFDPNLINIENAYTTALVSDEHTIKEYIRNGLLSNDSTSLAIFITENPNFFQFDANAVNEMHHVIALKTLTQFGFKKHQIICHLGVIWQTISVDDWLENHMSITFPDLQVQTLIRTNRNLLHYLRCIVEYINVSHVYKDVPDNVEICCVQIVCSCGG
jgi:hypothetical protein